jgi:hypothetical protein
MVDASIRVGQAAPNPALSAMKYFRRKSREGGSVGIEAVVERIDAAHPAPQPVELR